MDSFIEKRIKETQTEVFPLDRMLPLETVYSIFESHYKKTEDKNLFFKDRQFQRLREGYFGLFVAASLQDISKKAHYLIFPSDPKNDYYIGYIKSFNKEGVPHFEGYAFDSKEFTNFSPSFENFAQKSVIPKIDIYNLAIATYRKMEGKDLKLLVDALRKKGSKARVWILGLPSEDDYSYDISNVTIINKDGITYEKVINLADFLDKTNIPIIYEDVIKFRQKSN